MTGEAGTDWYDVARRPRASRRRAADRSSEWPEPVPAVALSGGPLGAVQAADREIARQTALRARAVAAFAASRPASADRAQGEPGAMSPDRWAGRPEGLFGVSEWAAPELVGALSISFEAAEALLTRSRALVHCLPGTLAALEAGAFHPGHLHPMLEKVAPIEDAPVRAQVEAGLLRWAAGRVITPAQLGARARREVARCDARAAARQLEKAIADRGVHLRPGSTDGMAVVAALMTEPEAQVLYRALGAYADAVADNPDAPRTRGQKMVDCLFDLVLRPGGAEGPPVQILLTVVASVGTLAGGDEPGEVGGQVVPAEIVRQLLRLLGPGEPSAPLRSEPWAPGRSEPSAPSAPLCTEPSAPRRAEQLASVGSSPALVHAEPVFRGAHEGAAAGSEPATSRAEPEGRRPEPLWQQVEQEELERWWAELERRVLAEEVGPVPERIPDRAWDFATFVDLEPPDCDAFDTDPLGHDPGADTHARAAGGEDPPEGDSVDPARGSTDRSGSAVESGWWAVADGAGVDAAQ